MSRSDSSDIESLLTTLSDENAATRRAAILALGELGDIRAVEPVIAAIDDQDVRVVIAVALGNIGDARGVEPLIGMLENRSETDWVVHSQAAKALGKIGDTRAVEPLIVALKYGSASYGAAEALGEIGDARAIEPLADALGGSDATLRDGTLSESDGNLRQAAAEALAKLGDVRSIDPLIDALGGRYLINRDRAARALGAIGIPAVKPLIAALSAEPGVAISTLEKLRDLEINGVPKTDDSEDVHQIIARSACELASVLSAEQSVSKATPRETPSEPKTFLLAGMWEGFQKAGWSDLSKKSRWLLQNYLEEDDEPWLVSRCVKAFYQGVFAATADSLVFVPKTRKLEEIRSLGCRYAIDKITNLANRGAPKIGFTYEGNDIVINSTSNVFWPLARRFPQMASGIIIAPDAINAAIETGQVRKLEISCLVGTAQLKPTLLYQNARGSASYVKNTYDIVASKHVGYAQRIECKQCGDELWVIKGRLWIMKNDVLLDVEYEDRVVAAMSGGNSVVRFPRHKNLGWR